MDCFFDSFIRTSLNLIGVDQPTSSLDPIICTEVVKLNFVTLKCQRNVLDIKFRLLNVFLIDGAVKTTLVLHCSYL